MIKYLKKTCSNCGHKCPHVRQKACEDWKSSRQYRHDYVSTILVGMLLVVLIMLAYVVIYVK